MKTKVYKKVPLFDRKKRTARGAACLSGGGYRLSCPGVPLATGVTGIPPPPPRYRSDWGRPQEISGTWDQRLGVPSCGQTDTGENMTSRRTPYAGGINPN